MQGLGAAFIMPTTLSILTNVFPDAERGRAIGIWAGVSGLGVAIGPLAGGWLLEHYWWGSIFLVNLPVIAVGVTLVVTLVPTSKAASAPRIDIPATIVVDHGPDRAPLRRHRGAEQRLDRTPSPSSRSRSRRC